MKILFLHGWQSVPGGVKPTFLAQHGHDVINPALPDEDFKAAVQIAQAEFDRHQPDAVVGSSRGGAVAMNINSGKARLVLLCPAWKRWGTARSVKPATVILHSRADDVIPFADSEELVRNSGLSASGLIEVGTDHRLAEPEPLASMLRACGASPRISAGLLMYRIRAGKLQVLLAHPGGPRFENKDEKAWSIPKGEVQPGEDLLETAKREFREESGVSPTGRFIPLMPVQQKGGKIVHAWAFEGDCDARATASNTITIEWPSGSGQQIEIPESDRADFFDIDVAKRKIKAGQEGLLEELERIGLTLS
jgi:predicted NUDIX family NTP pyrophosphohydrolase